MLIYLLIYAFMQIGAFAVIIMMRRRDMIGDELKDLSGLYLRHPFAAFAMLLFMLSLGGIPPTAGFMGKFWLFSAAIEAGYVWLAVIGVLNSAISLYYYIRIVVFMYLKKETTGSEPATGPALAFTLAVAVIATHALGVYPRLLFEAAERSAAGAESSAGFPRRSADLVKYFTRYGYTHGSVCLGNAPPVGPCPLTSAFRAGSAIPASGWSSRAPSPGSR